MGVRFHGENRGDKPPRCHGRISSYIAQPDCSRGRTPSLIPAGKNLSIGGWGLPPFFARCRAHLIPPRWLQSSLNSGDAYQHRWDHEGIAADVNLSGMQTQTDQGSFHKFEPARCLKWAVALQANGILHTEQRFQVVESVHDFALL